MALVLVADVATATITTAETAMMSTFIPGSENATENGFELVYIIMTTTTTTTTK